MSEQISFLSKIKNIGVAAELSAVGKKSVVLLNLTSVGLLGLSVLMTLFAFGTRASGAAFLFLLPSFWFGVLFLNRKGLYHIAASLFCVGGLIMVISLAAVFEHNQFYYWLLPLSLGPFLIFPSEYRKWGNLFSGLIWLSFSIVLYVSTKDAFSLLVSIASLMMLPLGVYARNINLVSEIQLKEERVYSEQLLRNFIPKKFVRTLMSLGGEAPMIAQRHEDVIVLFADIVNFTPMSEELPPEQLVQVLNELFTEFDVLIAKYGLEKIKTIGDAYMIAAGVPEPMDDPEIAVADFALEMRGAVQKVDKKWQRDLDIRIGIHLGPVVAGVIGIQKYAFDLWGDTVNVAARMESHGLPGQIHLSEVMADKLKENYVLTQRGWVDVKGKGMMQTFWLKGKENAATKTVARKPRLSDGDTEERQKQKAPVQNTNRSAVSRTNSAPSSQSQTSATEVSTKREQVKPTATKNKASRPTKPNRERSGVFRRTISPEDEVSRSDLFKKRSPRAGASTLPPPDVLPTVESSGSRERAASSASSSGNRTNAFRKKNTANTDKTGEATTNTKRPSGKSADAFRRSKD